MNAIQKECLGSWLPLLKQGFCKHLKISSCYLFSFIHGHCTECGIHVHSMSMNTEFDENGASSVSLGSCHATFNNELIFVLSVYDKFVTQD